MEKDKEDKLIHIGNGIWAFESELQSIREYRKELDREFIRMLLLSDEESELELAVEALIYRRYNSKFIIILDENGNNELAIWKQETNGVYKLNSDMTCSKEIIGHLSQVKMVRWASGFDL